MLDDPFPPDWTSMVRWPLRLELRQLELLGLIQDSCSIHPHILIIHLVYIYIHIYIYIYICVGVKRITCDDLVMLSSSTAKTMYMPLVGRLVGIPPVTVYMSVYLVYIPR